VANHPNRSPAAKAYRDRYYGLVYALFPRQATVSLMWRDFQELPLDSQTILLDAMERAKIARG
jgi:hypothetical protein